MELGKRSPSTSWMLFGSTILFMSFQTATSVSNNNNNNNNNNINNIHNGIPPSHYSLNQHVSFDPEEEQVHLSAETETMAFYNPINLNTIERKNEHTCISSTFISMESGMYQITNQESSTISNQNNHSIRNFFDVDFDFSEFEESEDDESDDDDDDDDGHSMMLSNISLRKSFLVSAGGDSNANGAYYHISTNDSNDSKTNKPKVSSKIQRQPSSDFSSSNIIFAKHTALSVRGGATTSPRNEFAKRIVVAALVTLIYEACLGHLLEFVKVVMQTSPTGTSYVDVLKIITSEKGIAGIWDGFIPWGVVQSIAKGGVFGLARAMALSVLMPLVDSQILPNVLALTLAGGISGGFQGYVLSPTLLLKTRVMTNPVFRNKMSMVKTTLLSFRIGMDVVNQEGISALMKGANVFALKRVFDWSTRFYFSHIFSNIIKIYFVPTPSPDTPVVLSATQKITADLLGGTASTLVTLPLDVLTTKSQDSKKAGIKVSAIKMFQEELNEKGVKGLYDSYMRGFEARLLHVCFTTVAMKTGTGLMYDYLFKKH